MSRRALVPFSVISLLAGAALPERSVALDPSGTTVRVQPAAAASGAAGSRILEVQGAVFMGDEIKTDPNGQAQIRFVDETRFVVGPNSKVLIDEFVFDPNKTAQQVGINAVKGAFRFISGGSPKGVYSVRTPTMTIGVRGTAFDLAVRGGGESTLVLHEGEVRLCDVTRRCIEVPEGSVVVAPPGGGFQTLPPGAVRRQRLSALVPFGGAQAGLDPEFQVTTSISVGNNSDGNVPESGRQKTRGSPEPRRSSPEPVSRPEPEPDRPPDGRPP